ncbi:tetratricopeptide repeat protein [uncultured Psychroserpens sp.]|uniref:tetratricopeptide repeat protein n=1 Tax=uncultured Psychroserpens sp. TaxID=255436 RepID=UPI002636C836|nr:tetratricopeptide repeat protein [uncultured Psychroserpens sp.]
MKNIKSSVFILVLTMFFSIASFAQEEAVIDSLENVLRHHKKNDTTKVNLLNTLAYGYSSRDINKSDEKVQEAYDLAKELNFKAGEAESLLRFGHNYIKKAELEEAEVFALKALTLCEDINDQDCINSSYICLAEIAYYESDNDKAKDYYEKLVAIFIKDGDSLSQADMLNNLGILSYREGDFDAALNSLKKAYTIREKLGYEKLSLGTLNNIGAICLNQGRYTEALKYFNKCLSIYRDDKNKRGIAQATYNMSAVYYELKQYDKTLSYLDEALDIYNELKDRRQIASSLVNKGAVYADLKEFTKALDYMTESLKICNEINHIPELSAGHFQLGDLRLLMEQPNTALEHYKTCLELAETIEDLVLVCQAHVGLARTYVLLENYPSALDHALKGKKIADDLELLGQQKLVSETLATIYSNTGDYKKAFESHQEFKIVNDSLFNKENIEKITQLEYEYKYRQQLDSLSINELRLTKTIKTTSQDLEKSQRNYLWATIGILLLSILLGAFFFYQKLKNAKSKTQNALMEQKLLRSQMTPHFIFNSLSVLQGMILNKEEKKSVNYLSKFSKLLRITLENSRDKTVSLSQELTAVQEYLTLQNLENEAYKCTILVDDSIDVELFEIPPMLIQPFVENAIEHAFEDQKEDRKIDIRLMYSDKNLICTIADNGVGINFKTENTNNNKNSLATRITSERLRVLSKDFNMKGSVTIEDRKKFNEQGTLVTLVIPHKLIES